MRRLAESQETRHKQAVQASEWITRARQNALAICLVALGLTLLASALLGTRGLSRVASLGRESRRVEARNFSILQENVRLRDELRGLRANDAKLEQVVRRRLHLVQDGETLYRWDSDAAAGAGVAHSASSAHSANNSSYSSGSSRSSSSPFSRNSILTNQPSR